MRMLALGEKVHLLVLTGNCKCGVNTDCHICEYICILVNMCSGLPLHLMQLCFHCKCGSYLLRCLQTDLQAM